MRKWLKQAICVDTQWRPCWGRTNIQNTGRYPSSQSSLLHREGDLPLLAVQLYLFKHGDVAVALTYALNMELKNTTETITSNNQYETKEGSTI